MLRPMFLLVALCVLLSCSYTASAFSRVPGSPSLSRMTSLKQRELRSFSTDDADFLASSPSKTDLIDGKFAASCLIGAGILVNPMFAGASVDAASHLSTFSQFVADSDVIGDVGYSKYSLYGTLGLYVLTLPGLFSLVTRSVKTKPVTKVYDIPGPANPSAKPLRQTAAEIMAYFKAMNYEVETAEEVITFKGVLQRSNSQAAFLTFCTFMGLGSLGLVLSILVPDIGGNFYLLTLLSPYAGIYYWRNAQRVEEVQVKLETSDDDQMTSIIALGGKEDLERFSKTLQLPERGKVYVKGLFDDFEDGLNTEGGVIAESVDEMNSIE